MHPNEIQMNTQKISTIIYVCRVTHVLSSSVTLVLSNTLPSFTVSISTSDLGLENNGSCSFWVRQRSASPGHLRALGLQGRVHDALANSCESFQCDCLVLVNAAISSPWWTKESHQDLNTEGGNTPKTDNKCKGFLLSPTGLHMIWCDS